MCVDIYMKAFPDASKWIAACDLINIVDPSRLRQFMIDCIAPPTPVAMSSSFGDEPTRCDLDTVFEKFDDDRQLVEIHLVDHDSKFVF